MKQLVSFLCLGLFVAVGFPALSHAQIDNLLNQQSISINSNPPFPSPFESVTITLDDYTLTPSSQTINWTRDGNPIPNTNNERSIQITTPAAGESTVIAITVTRSNGDVYTDSITLRPVYLDIIVEPFTYAPAHYAGRPLPTHQSQILLTSLLHTGDGLANPANYSYSWTINNKPLDGGSRQSGSQALFPVPGGQSFLVGLTISDQRNRVVARQLIRIPTTSVDLQFYEVSDLFGLSHLVAQNPLPLIGNSTTIRAVPYNLDTTTPTNQLFTEWKINNRTQSVNMFDPFAITVTRSGTGSSNISFKLRNLEALLQGGERSLSIRY